MSGLTHQPEAFVGLSRSQRFILSMTDGLGINSPSFRSQRGQDAWVVRVVFPGVENGYYVDVGSGDGVVYSNTKVLDDLGWAGICIDPFPVNMETRTAQVFKEVVFSEKGQKVKFRAAGMVGRIEGEANQADGSEGNQRAELVEFTTTTLDDILARGKAPKFIHYMNLDIEGAELEALKGFSFSKYKVGAFTIEHNWEEPRRSQIRSLLESNGYRTVHTEIGDDLFVLAELCEDRPIIWK